MSFCLLQMLTDGLEWCGLLVMFLSAVWTLILTAPIHCRGFIGEQVMEWYISPNLIKNQTHLHLGWSEEEHISANVNNTVSIFSIVSCFCFDVKVCLFIFIYKKLHIYVSHDVCVMCEHVQFEVSLLDSCFVWTSHSPAVCRQWKQPFAGTTVSEFLSWTLRLFSCSTGRWC